MDHYTKTKRVQDILQKNIDLNGPSMEVDVAIEEMSELTKELVKHRRGRKNLLNIAEEIADVEIMMEQLKMIFKCHGLVAEQLDAKVEHIREELCKAGIVVKGGAFG